ncbi:MAG: hypothetical protein MJ060_03730 [Clostridia bacterium]|nr:hypothetical protein [Clostridia bacterium]
MANNNILPTNCPNCGAVLKNGKCEYCGTRVMFPNTLDVFTQGSCDLTLNVKDGDKVIILPLRGCINEITMHYGCASEQEIEFCFSGILRERE